MHFIESSSLRWGLLLVWRDAMRPDFAFDHAIFTIFSHTKAESMRKRENYFRKGSMHKGATARVHM